MPGIRRRGQRGQATTEVVLLVPVLLLLIMSVVHFGLWYHGGHVVRAAAQEGVRAARIENGTADDGRARAERFLASAAPTLVSGHRVSASRSLDVATVEVQGRVVGVIPGLVLPVRARATSPVETFRLSG